uniref:Uncharacterized protein n=1 Tax=Arundo donax TaxID=35708 RepID=A0A0A9CY07_ARUDO
MMGCMDMNQGTCTVERQLVCHHISSCTSKKGRLLLYLTASPLHADVHIAKIPTVIKTGGTNFQV